MTGIDRLKPLADSLYGDQDPVKRLSEAESIRFDLQEKRYTLSLQVAGVQGKEIGLEKIGDELRVQIGRFKRTIALPQYVAGLQPTSARLDDGTLKIVFEE